MDNSEQYIARRPTYESLANSIKDLLSHIAKSIKIEVHTIEGRAKTVDSFLEKTTRSGKSYTNAIEEITDLCGLRVILYYQEDVQKFSNELRAQFIIDETKSSDKRKELRLDQFGYISVHLVGKIDDSRSKLVEWSQYKGLNFEIQVRTVLQHAWASISHALDYKSIVATPDQFRRQLSRIAGLLELSDEQFSELRAKKSSLEIEVQSSISNNDFNVTINAVSLVQYLESSKNAAAVGSAVRNARLVVTGIHGSEHLSFLCERLDIESLVKLDKILIAFVEKADVYFDRLASLCTSGDQSRSKVIGDLEHWCAVAVIASVVKNHESVISNLSKEIGWDNSYMTKVILANA
ncbi:ppGpp synthetase catalytic domain-containing protein (RelA/SpoT-type nucleotidyltranferase) [Pseudomonas syringae]|uniref:GTP pyrophosphokinase n=1 Tax=Pseudomonas syringae TaxID=317 RepID=UPI0008954989|nr:hypothetical protein [Pseudomonas syringae]SDW45051.1 ppGpp synthetase catalytic domain-containing protein (RelA/SpoT-type nucleotidyltranferase) [Pseudomonas syringae]SFL71944.1 ppGpp synthetase catalytic domain-containing protein (RelA/SpoT-type nucleotidyltranferase) [Pseudomonas syringae]